MIKEYKLINRHGISIIIISFGGAIKEINTPSRNGKFENIVLGYKNNSKYLNDEYYMGTLVGRYANRIAKGSFKLNDRIIKIEKNENKNHLHGGANGFHKKNWNLVSRDRGLLIGSGENSNWAISSMFWPLTQRRWTRCTCRGASWLSH